MKNKKLILPGILFLGALAVWVFSGSKLVKPLLSKFSKNNQVSEAQSEQQIKLPEGWELAATQDAEIKIIKPSLEYISSIVLTKSTSTQDIINPKDYSDKLITGAKSALPSLKIINDDVSQKDNFYLRTLRSTYQSNKQKISLLQQVYFDSNSNTVYVLTGSYQNSADETVINQLFESIYAAKIQNRS